jgi:hypothetical protein
MKHFLSDSGIWKIIAEFVDPDGNVMHSEGESVISVSETEIINDVWVVSQDINRRNTYRIKPVAKNKMIAESTNPDLPQLTGTFNVDRNILHFKYQMEGSELNGYEIISRKRNVCYAYGAVYNGNTLRHTWTAVINKK